MEQYVASIDSLHRGTRVNRVSQRGINPSPTSHVVEHVIIAAARSKELLSSRILPGHRIDRECFGW